jgi:hypothetical protein
MHEDEKVIGFKIKHWHIDWRFIETSFWRSEVFNGSRWSSIGKRETARIVCYNKSSEYVIEQGLYSNFTDDDKIYYRKLKCKRGYSCGEYFDYDFERDLRTWTHKLPKVFCKSKLKEKNGQLVCPHKGIIIDKNTKDKDGNYVCPGHLLRFNPDSLLVVN